MNNLSQTNNDNIVEVAKVFLLNDKSATLIIPAEIARKHGLHRGSHVTVQDRQDGILIKKLKVGAD
jgi:Antidote-toxin recognition MazE, bacterial antitoxin